MSAEIIEFAAAKSGKRRFVFREACPVCQMMVAPYIVAGRVTDRFRCDGRDSHSGVHDPYHWKSGDHDVSFGNINPGYDIPPAIKRSRLNLVPDVS
jgi:hypothetical protein